jgi:hypothetical protein
MYTEINTQRSVGGGIPKYPVGFCTHYKAPISSSEVKLHRCLQRNCPHLERYEGHNFWKQRARKKELRNERRKKFSEMLNGNAGL